MTVDAKDGSACVFYKKFGFEPLTDDKLHLYIPRSDLEACFIKSKQKGP
jgi:hypothetical protein